ncbi:AfaD family invasin [Pantoea agglomerans]|uniref:AfaD family invasin n=1 Tax=Enterobacter agglomerans TaxID=549 RepID=UPI003DA05717
MNYPFKMSLNCTVMVLILFNQYSEANALKITVTPKQDLHAGKIHDGAELATIHVSGMPDSCLLNVWIEHPNQETSPGHYRLTGRNKTGDDLNVRITGDNVKPDSRSGKGVLIALPTRLSTLNLLINGDQLIKSSVFSMQVSAQCLNQ